MTNPFPPSDSILFQLARAAQRRALQNRRLRERRQLKQATPAPSTHPKKRSARQIQGDAYEEQALALLLRAGCRLLERQLHSPFGEIDLIVRHDDTLVFVEVRSRSSARFGGALASVTRAKQKKLLLTANWCLASLVRRHFLDRMPPCRIDVIAFEQAQVFWHRDVVRIGQDK